MFFNTLASLQNLVYTSQFRIDKYFASNIQCMSHIPDPLYSIYLKYLAAYD